jgi:hypothetical protein
VIEINGNSIQSLDISPLFTIPQFKMLLLDKGVEVSTEPVFMERRLPVLFVDQKPSRQEG